MFIYISIVIRNSDGIVWKLTRSCRIMSILIIFRECGTARYWWCSCCVFMSFSCAVKLGRVSSPSKDELPNKSSLPCFLPQNPISKSIRRRKCFVRRIRCPILHRPTVFPLLWDTSTDHWICMRLFTWYRDDYLMFWTGDIQIPLCRACEALDCHANRYFRSGWPARAPHSFRLSRRWLYSLF